MKDIFLFIYICVDIRYLSVTMVLTLMKHHTPSNGGTGSGERDKNLASVEWRSELITSLGTLRSPVRKGEDGVKVMDKDYRSQVKSNAETDRSPVKHGRTVASGL